MMGVLLTPTEPREHTNLPGIGGNKMECWLLWPHNGPATRCSYGKGGMCKYHSHTINSKDFFGTHVPGSLANFLLFQTYFPSRFFHLITFVESAGRKSWTKPSDTIEGPANLWGKLFCTTRAVSEPSPICKPKFISVSWQIFTELANCASPFAKALLFGCNSKHN